MGSRQVGERHETGIPDQDPGTGGGMLAARVLHCLYLPLAFFVKAFVGEEM